ncbi:MAG: AAA family ATPase [Clostridium sp.]|jgi:replicative DNA helicase|nr:AAA family ATPase [Clostridium sp.]
MSDGIFAELTAPSNTSAEQAVLGSILREPACADKLLAFLKPEDFYLPQHKAIFRVIAELRAAPSSPGTAPIDPLVVLRALVAEKSFDDAAGRKYLFELAQSVPSTANVMSYAAMVRKDALRRELMALGAALRQDAAAQAAEPGELIEQAEQELYKLRQGDKSDEPRVFNSVAAELYSALAQRVQNGEQPGLMTGFRRLDRLLGGLHAGDFVIIGARPGAGKTSFALQIAMNAARSGHRTLFFSLEMSAEQLVARAMAGESQVSGSLFRRGTPNADEFARLADSLNTLNKPGSRLLIDDEGALTVGKLRAKIRRAWPAANDAQKKSDETPNCQARENTGIATTGSGFLEHHPRHCSGPCLVIVDYLGLMEDKSPQRGDVTRAQELSRITRGLKTRGSSSP